MGASQPLLTADTITDEQIRELRDEANDTRNDCTVALGYPLFLSPTASEVRAARARCAELINARAENRCMSTLDGARCNLTAGHVLGHDWSNARTGGAK